MPELFDTAYQVETPEAIDFSAHTAGPLPRILAYSIDLSIRITILLALALLLALFGEAGWGGVLIASFLFEWFYPVVFEVFMHGQTPGKKILKIAAVNDDLTPITWSTSLIRNLLRAVDILPFAYVIGIISMTCTQHFQRLGDLAAGSIVVHRRTKTEENTLPTARPQAFPVTLTIEDQIAISAFARRHTQLSDDRLRELAEILSEITGKSGTEAVQYLYGAGNWILGKRE